MGLWQRIKVKLAIEKIAKQHVPTIEEINKENAQLKQKEAQVVGDVIKSPQQKIPKKKGGKTHGC